MKAFQSIEKDTPIMPYVVAVSVIEEAERILKQEIPHRGVYSVYLMERAEEVYANNERMRKLIRAKGNKGRDILYAFMRHWLVGELFRQNRRLGEQLMPEFGNGAEIASR